MPRTFAQHQIGRSSNAKRFCAQALATSEPGRNTGERARGNEMFNSGCTSSFAKWICLSLALALALFSAAPTRAQVSGATLSGLVTDEQGGPVADATVSVKNSGTGFVQEVPTNGDGIYSAPNLLPGSYEITISAKGFQTLVQ